jgi:hypothetical protein
MSAGWRCNCACSMCYAGMRRAPMTSDKLRKSLLATLASFTIALLAAPALLAQSTPPDAPVSASAPVVASSRFPDIFPSAVAPVSSSGSPAFAISPVLVTSPSTAPEHPRRFFDKWNLGLFTGSAALDSADFAVTRANLQTAGGKELNPIVRMFGRSTAGLAVNFAGEAAGTVGLSYFFHKTGHYKLERAVSMVNIGATSFAVSYSSSHR